MKKTNIYNIKLPAGQISYPRLDEPTQYKNQGAFTYSATLVYDKVEDAEKIKFIEDELKKILTKEKGALSVKNGINSKYTTPWKDGDELFNASQEVIDEEIKSGKDERKNPNSTYKGKMIFKIKKNAVTAKGVEQRILIQKRVKGVITDIDPKDVVAGDYYTCLGSVFPYEKGLTFHANLLGLVKKTDNPFGGSRQSLGDEDEYIEPETSYEEISYDEDNSEEFKTPN